MRKSSPGEKRSCDCVRGLIAILILNAAAAAQVSVYGGNTLVYGNSILNGPATYTNIYVVFPPPPLDNNYSNFTANVMTQDAIDGVTLLVPWNAVELSSPSMTACSPVGTDMCQQDQTNPLYYHSYNWMTIDGSGCGDTNPQSSSPWFCSFGGVYKTVNFVLVGAGDIPTDGFTPTFVTGSNWMTAVGASQPQDVVNTINASGCGIKYSGSITSIPTNATFTGNGSNTVNVTNWASPPVVAGDTIWVSGLTGAASSLNVTGQNGATVSTSGCGLSANFCYTGGGTSTAFGTPTSVVKAVDSWPVPYELPFASGWLAFLKAAIYHFSNLNYPGRSWQNHSRIRYIRPGVAQGGEARPICATYAPMTGASPAYSEPVWTNGTSPTGWYTQVVQAVQSANPLMQIMFSINVGETSLVPIDASFANDEAAVAVTYSNSTGLYDGFGSQGLEHSDTAFTGATCPEAGTAPDTGNNWGCMFTKYWSGSNMTYGTMVPNPTTVPLELQQIDCSNPTGVYDAQDGCFLGNTGGDTGSLVSLYAFATLNHASILELYNQDALLAYDPNFCDPNMALTACTNTAGYDWFGSSLSASTQFNFFTNAGQGTMSCSGYPATCPYASAINTAHGPH
jgi:hypothetical protein